MAPTSSEPAALENAEPIAPDVAETTTAKAVRTPAKAKRVFARPGVEQPEASADDAIASPPKQKKPRAAPKRKVDPEPEADAEPIATAPRRGRPKKQIAEA